MVDVKCPFCGRDIPYPAIARQLTKRRHDRNLVLKIIGEVSEAESGYILRQYNILHSPMSLRTLNNILKELENEGKITRRVEHRGRYGLTTVVKMKEGK